MTSFSQDTDSQSWPESGLPFDLKDLTISAEGPAETFRLRGESNPTRQARDLVSQIQNTDIVKQLNKLLLIIDIIFNYYQQKGVDLSRIPPLHPYVEEDGSVLLEWIFPDFRIGFNIEPNPDDSGYHKVLGKKLGDKTESGQLVADMSKVVIHLFFNVILPNI